MSDGPKCPESRIEMFVLSSRWVLGVSSLTCTAALLAALTLGTRSNADSGSSEVATALTSAAQATVDEVPALRTESSRTYRKADGSYEAQVSAGPVNYRDASGSWKLIDTDFAADGSGGLETTHAVAKVSLPESLAEPVKVMASSRWVSFALAGADTDAAPQVDGATATYNKVLDRVDAVYDAQPTGVKETLTLADASARATYRYAVDASPGLTPALLDNGTVVLRDAGGTTRFWLPAPTVQETGAANPTSDHVAYHLSGDNRTLTVAVDPSWLANASFPVRLDPSIWYGDGASCTLASGAPTATACGGTTLKVGHDAAGRYRTALRFPDMALAVPRNASVMTAGIGLYFESQTSSTAITPVTMSGLSKVLGTGATWNTYDNNASHAWTTAGGDIVADPQAATSSLYASYADGWVNFNISRLVEQWLRTPSTNNGVLLRAQNETGSPNNVISFDGHAWDHGGPTIRIDYELHPGFERDQSFESVVFDGTSKIAVNAATGNIAVDGTDISLPGVAGLDLNIRRTFNGQNLGSGGGMFGSAWSESIDNASYVNDRVWYDDSRTIYANGRGIYRFDRDPVHDTSTVKAYLSPPNINADLVADKSTDIATLTFRDTGVKWTYGPSYDGYHVALTKISDASGHHIDIAPKGSQSDRIGTITDTNGTVLTFTYGTNLQLTKISDGTHDWKYTTTIVNTHNLLTGYTNPSNQTTSYHYDSTALPGTWDKLDRVIDHDGQVFSLTYGSQGDYSQVTQVRQDFTDSRPDNITNFSYKPSGTAGHACTTPVANSPYPDSVVFDRTVETDNTGQATTYCYNTSAQVIQAWRPWDAVAPTITGSPQPFVFQDSYTNGVTPIVVGLSADDTQSGVKRVALEEVGHSELTSTTSPCPPTVTMPNLCPSSYSSSVTVDPAPLAEGAHTVRQVASDLAGNVATSDTWAINVDRTPPGAPAGLDATVDNTGNAVVSWYPSLDPALPDGTPGAGTTGYSVRYRVGSGAWEGPTVTAVPSFRVPGATVGQSAALEITPGDAVGNIGGVFPAVVMFAANTDPCSATPRPDVCLDPTDGSPVDAEEDPDIDIDGSGGAGQSLTTATLFHLRSHDAGCATSRCWATIRSKPQSWAIGNVRLEYPGAAANVAATSTLRRISTSNHWHLGSLSDYSNHCAWVSGTLLSGGSPSTSGCDDPSFGPEFWQWQSIPYSTPGDQMPNGTSVRGNNCFNKSGTYRRPGKNTCDRGTAVFLTGPTVECANVYVVPDGTSTSGSCAKKDIVRNLNTPSDWGHYCVNWRYVTRDRQWVLVRDQRELNRGGWVFIRSSALPAQRTSWHAYDDDGSASCPPSSN